VYGSGKFGGTTVVARDLPTYYTLIVLCVREANSVEEQQQKRTQSGNSKLKWTQSGNSSWSGCSWGAAAEADAIGAQFGLTTRD